MARLLSHHGRKNWNCKLQSKATRKKTVQTYHVNLLMRGVGNQDELAALVPTEAMVVGTNPELSATQKIELRHLVGQFQDMLT